MGTDAKEVLVGFARTKVFEGMFRSGEILSSTCWTSAAPLPWEGSYYLQGLVRKENRGCTRQEPSPLSLSFSLFPGAPSARARWKVQESSSKENQSQKTRLWVLTRDLRLGPKRCLRWGRYPCFFTSIIPGMSHLTARVALFAKKRVYLSG